MNNDPILAWHFTGEGGCGNTVYGAEELLIMGYGSV